MMKINDWQHLINAIRKIAKNGGPSKTNEKRFKHLIQSLKEKGIRIDELNTEY